MMKLKIEVFLAVKAKLFLALFQKNRVQNKSDFYLMSELNLLNSVNYYLLLV